MTSPSCFSTPVPLHGGPDAAGVPVFDFSTNSNACGPCPEALHAVQSADATHYPDPAYTALREGLGAFHGVTPARIVLAASASEFIHRMTALAAQQGAVQVAVPPHSYGDYAQAAQVRGLDVVRGGGAAAGLQWACEPSSPLGRADPAVRTWQDGSTVAALRVLDCAYAPLRLDEEGAWTGSPSPHLPSACWQLWTPNKAMGLALGVRLTKPGVYQLHAQGRAPPPRDVGWAQKFASKVAWTLSGIAVSAIFIVAIQGAWNA